MVVAKIFQADDLTNLETEMQAYLDSIETTIDWADHDVVVQYDGKTMMSRMSYSALLFIKPNKNI